MNALDRIIESWKQASAELGFTFLSPYRLENVEFMGLIPDFGSPKGMLIFYNEDLETDPWAKIAEKYGFGYSCLGCSYEKYNKELFIDTLNDWRWSPKSEQPPHWYTGEPWSS
jgi:hypothetical protein